MTYREKQEQVRQKAIEWQLDLTDNKYSWYYMMVCEEYFHKLGKRYGLLREFHENGIC